MKSNLLAAALVAVSVVAFAPRAGSEDKPAPGRVAMGYITAQRVLEECDEGKKALSELKVKLETNHVALSKERDAIQLENEALQKGKFETEEANHRRAELQKRSVAWQEKYQKIQSEMRENEALVTQRIMSHIKAACRVVASEEGVAFILNDAAIVHAPPALDLTNNVIRHVNKITAEKK